SGDFACTSSYDLYQSERRHCRKKLPGNRVGGIEMRQRYRSDSPVEGTGFEPSVPLGRIGASNSAWIEFGRRLGLRIEHAISIDGWEVCDGRTSWRFFMRQIEFLTVTRECCSSLCLAPVFCLHERRS